MPPRQTKAAVAKSKVKLYKFPDPIRPGEIVTDLSKCKWQIGKSIGVGGFGEIYAASDDLTRPVGIDARYVIKIEPHENGPLFTEMHFYHRVAKPELVDNWIREKKLKFLGMPTLVGSGSHEYKGTKYRFLVIERFGQDLQKLFEVNGRRFSTKTVFTLGIKIFDVLEYIHSFGYVHADVKASNILLGYNDKSQEKAYLVDFGLVCRYSTDGNHKPYKPDPKKAHDGTIEFTSRDAHIGLQSRRGDLEILGYNLLQWLSGKLPWENNLNSPEVVKNLKNSYFENIPKLMQDCFKTSNKYPAIEQYFKYVASLKFDEEPDYDYCRELLNKEMKRAKLKNDGKFDFPKLAITSLKVVKEVKQKPAKYQNENDEAEQKLTSSAHNSSHDVSVRPKRVTRSSPKSEKLQEMNAEIENPTPEMLALMEKRATREKQSTRQKKLKRPSPTLNADAQRKMKRRNTSPNNGISPELF